MKRSRIPSFRGLRALIEHPAGADRTILHSQLERLGLIVAIRDAAAGAADPDIDVFFFDADGNDRQLAIDECALPQDVPIIALIGSEAPSRLEALFARQPSAYLTKPIRRTGIYSCLAIAMHHFAILQQLNGRLLAAEQRLKHRRKVVQAVIKLMHCEAVNEDTAYRMLQRAAMSRRQSIEALSVDIVTGRRPLSEFLVGVHSYSGSELG